MNSKKLAENIIANLGGSSNIIDAENCMTRLRINVHDSSKVDYEKLKSMNEVLGLVGEDDTYIQIVLGPGKVRDVMQELSNSGIKEVVSDDTDVDWKKNKEDIKKGQKSSKFKNMLQSISNIFIPMIPAFIASGICNGLSRVVKIMIENGTLSATTGPLMVQLFLEIIGKGFLSYLVVFTGVNAAKEFRVNAMLGGMIGIAAIDARINSVAELIGWYDPEAASDAILSSGAGGVLGVILGVWILSKVEKWIHNKMPNVLDISFTPLLSMIITMPIFVLIVMPITGFISVAIGNFIGFFVDSSNPIVLFLTGYLLAATFLPLVLFGLHRGLTPIYTLQIEATGATKLFPAVAMAGAGQVGACIALFIKAKKVNNKKLEAVIAGGLPAGILGIGEPLIYGVTLPMMRPFITAGLGAGFGGAYVMLMSVASTAFSPSGILAATHVLPELVGHYIIGILISYVAAAIITFIAIPNSMVEDY